MRVRHADLGQGRIYDATEAAMVPDPGLTIRERAIAAWPPAWHGQNLRDILVTLGYDVDKPWRDLPKKDRDWILFTHETPTVPVYAGFTPKETRAALRAKMEPSYMGTFTSACDYVLNTFANSQSALMKKRVSIGQWKFVSFPTYLSAAQVQKVLDGCDRASATGRREYAISAQHALSLQLLDALRR